VANSRFTSTTGCTRAISASMGMMVVAPDGYSIRPADPAINWTRLSIATSWKDGEGQERG
jgi:hypothetical protein